MSVAPRPVRGPFGVILVGGNTVEEQDALVAFWTALFADLERRNGNLASLLDPDAAVSAIDANQAWRDSPRAATVLAAVTDLSPNLTRNIIQDLVRESQRQARQLNTLWRLALAATTPQLLDDIDPA